MLGRTVLKTAPRVNGTNGPTLAPNGNGGIAPAFVPIDLEPFVMCAPGWTGPDCKTPIAPATGLPTGVDRAPPEAIIPRHVADAVPTYRMENGFPVLRVQEAEVVERFPIVPMAIAAAVAIGLVTLLQART